MAKPRSPFRLQLPLSLATAVAAVGGSAALLSPAGVGAAGLCFLIILLAVCCAGSGGLGGASFHYGPPSAGEMFLRVLALALLGLAVLVALLAWSPSNV